MKEEPQPSIRLGTLGVTVPMAIAVKALDMNKKSAQKLVWANATVDGPNTPSTLLPESTSSTWYYSGITFWSHDELPGLMLAMELECFLLTGRRTLVFSLKNKMVVGRLRAKGVLGMLEGFAVSIRDAFNCH